MSIHGLGKLSTIYINYVAFLLQLWGFILIVLVVNPPSKNKNSIFLLHRRIMIKSQKITYQKLKSHTGNIHVQYTGTQQIHLYL
jgi:hypothetical protein